MFVEFLWVLLLGSLLGLELIGKVPKIEARPRPANSSPICAVMMGPRAPADNPKHVIKTTSRVQF